MCDISLEDQGYETDISHVCGKLTNIGCQFSNIKLVIRSQRFIKHGLDGIL